MGSPIEPNEAPVISEDHHDEVDFAAGPRRDQAAVVVVEARVCRQCLCMCVWRGVTSEITVGP